MFRIIPAFLPIVFADMTPSEHPQECRAESAEKMNSPLWFCIRFGFVTALPAGSRHDRDIPRTNFRSRSVLHL